MSAPEAGRVSVSRDALRADLAEMEMRLRVYFDGRLNSKADSAMVLMLENRMTAIVTDLHARFDGTTKDIRLIQEGLRLSDERRRVSADTLAAETERRRSTLAEIADTADRKFTRSERMAGLVIALVSVLVTVYFSSKGF